MFQRTHDAIVRQGDFVRAFYDGIPLSQGVRNLRGPNANPDGGVQLTEEDRYFLRTTFSFIKSVEENHYQLGSGDPEMTLFYGVVKTINDKTKRASVIGWKVLGEVVASTNRPTVTFSLDALTKIMRPDFFVRCQKPCQKRLDHRTRLRAAGFDESAPLSLIAYNNRIVSSLMEVVDKSTVSSLHGNQRKKGRPRSNSRSIPYPPGTLKTMPAPQFMFTLDDPLAEVRAELSSLSVGSKKKDKGHSVLKSHHDEMISTGQVQRGDTSIMLNYASRGATPQDKAGSPCGTMSNTDAMIGVRYQSTKVQLNRSVSVGSSSLFVQLNSQSNTTARMGSQSKYRVCSVDSNTGVVYVMRDDSAGDGDLPIPATFQGIQLFCPKWDPSIGDEVAPAKVLQRLLLPSRGAFTGEVVGCGPGGVVILSATTMVGNSVSLSRRLLEEGAACLNGSALLQPDDGVEPSSGDITPTDLAELTNAQATAAANSIGLWKSEFALKGFLVPNDEDSLCVDRNASFDGAAVPLFTAMESAQGFRARFRQMVNLHNPQSVPTTSLRTLHKSPGSPSLPQRLHVSSTPFVL